VLAWKHATVEPINETMFIIGKKFINRSCMGSKSPVESCDAASAISATKMKCRIIAERLRVTNLHERRPEFEGSLNDTHYVIINDNKMPTALNYGARPNQPGTDAPATVQFTDMLGGVPKDLNLPNSRVWWCPSDRINTPTNSVITTNNYSSYRYRFVIWDNTVRFPGLKTSDFFRPVAQIVFHENQDSHYKRLPTAYTPAQPILNAIYADFHAALWKVIFRQNKPGNYYDPNWFSYGSNGALNTDNPNIGGDVHTGFDLK